MGKTFARQQKFARSLTLAMLFASVTPVTSWAEDNWHFRLTPYLWFAGLKGDVATIPGAPAAPIDISPSQAIEDTETGVMLLVDAKRGRHGLFADFLYTDVRSDEELVPPPIGLTLRSVTKPTLFSLAYQYEIYRREQRVIDLIAGARYWNIESRLSFGGGGGLLAGTTVSHDESWIDPMVGIKGHTPPGNSRFYLEGGAGLGGFGIGSDLFYEFSGGIGYQWTPAIGTPSVTGCSTSTTGMAVFSTTPDNRAGSWVSPGRSRRVLDAKPDKLAAAADPDATLLTHPLHEVT